MNRIDSGFVLVHKPPGITSFSALQEIKKGVYPLKVGHTGTLDKFAEGLLIAVVGKATKLASYITNLGKEYKAEIEFGRETDTLDPEGTVIKKNCPIPDRETVEDRAAEFVGEIIQVPPIYSAVHVRGERAHKLARKGEAVRLAGRPVRIYGMKVLTYEPPSLQLSVHCSKGTYIRSLARDLGKNCGSCGYVTKLRRNSIGGFSLTESVVPGDFKPERDIVPPERILERIESIHMLHCKSEYIERILYGKPVEEEIFTKIPSDDGIYAVLNEETEQFVALLERNAGSFTYKFVGMHV